MDEGNSRRGKRWMRATAGGDNVVTGDEYDVVMGRARSMVKWGALMAACSWSPLHLSWYSFTRQD